MTTGLFAALVALVISHSASAAMWDERVHGDLSNAGVAPSQLTLDRRAVRQRSATDSLARQSVGQ